MGESTISIKVFVRHPRGLHARPAQLFSERALQYKCNIIVLKDGVTADAKSILHLLSLGAVQDSELTISADGEDAQEALDSLAALVNDNFGFKDDDD